MALSNSGSTVSTVMCVSKLVRPWTSHSQISKFGPNSGTYSYSRRSHMMDIMDLSNVRKDRQIRSAVHSVAKQNLCCLYAKRNLIGVLGTVEDHETHWILYCQRPFSWIAGFLIATHSLACTDSVWSCHSRMTCSYPDRCSTGCSDSSSTGAWTPGGSWSSECCRWIKPVPQIAQTKRVGTRVAGTDRRMASFGFRHASTTWFKNWQWLHDQSPKYQPVKGAAKRFGTVL